MRPSRNRTKCYTLKTSSTRTPPEPAASHVELDELIRRKVVPDMHPLVKRLDKLICETIPGLRYAVKWGKAYYGLPAQGWILEMVPYLVAVNVVYFGGADFDHPPPLASLGRSQYVKLKSLEEGQGP
jgi:hypothetical protein